MTINDAIKLALFDGFKEYSSIQFGGQQIDTLTCLSGIYDGDVIEIFWDYDSGEISEIEISNQFGETPKFKYQ